MNDLISVVVPVYNVKEYLKECANSLLNQSYKNIEILLIDDGSTDGSSDLCDQFEKKDSRISVFHKENGGLSDARNFGITKVKGEYIIFVDSDDYCDNNLVESLYNLIIENNADIAIIEPAHFYNFDKCDFKEKTYQKKLSSEDAICEMLYQKSFLPSAWGKIYKKELFNNVKFPKGMLFEDIAVMYVLIDKSKIIAYSDAKLYGYRHRENSITTKRFSKKDLDILTISNEIVEYFKNRNDNLINASLAYALTANFRIYMNAPNTPEYSNVKKECENYIKTHCKLALKDKNTRKKMRFALYGFKYFRPLLNFVYSKIDRWK